MEWKQQQWKSGHVEFGKYVSMNPTPEIRQGMSEWGSGNIKASSIPGQREVLHSFAAVFQNEGPFLHPKLPVERVMSKELHNCSRFNIFYYKIKPQKFTSLRE